MKELTYQQIIEIAQREKALTVKNIASAIAGLIHKSVSYTHLTLPTTSRV